MAPLKGKRLTTFCASLALLHPLLSLTHWIFRSLMLPYKSSSHSAKCVRCAPKGNPRPSRRRRVKLKNLKNPRAGGPSTFSFTTLLRNLRRQPHPFFKSAAKPPQQPSWPKAPSNLRTLRPPGRSILRTFPSESYEKDRPVAVFFICHICSMLLKALI